MGTQRYNLQDLLRVMQRLRDPEHGCPWDLRQDFRSIVPSTLEECYELAEAIEQGDFEHVAEELGDVLFQVVFYAQLGSEADLFDFAQVVNTLVEKLLRRHPHVFADGLIEGVVREEASIDQVSHTWEAIKQAEREGKSRGGVLDDVPTALPALPRAQKLQKRAARVNFDWPGVEGAVRKLEEELVELQQAMDGGEREQVEDEMGDVLFTCANISRHLGIDAESSLRMACAKFEARFREMERLAAQGGQTLDGLSPEWREALWQRAKAAC